ncbi:MAG: flavodoxin family protein [Chloroflexi bacterium]|nr:flavodoxin family protein [Chloroflexota bacterium]
MNQSPIKVLGICCSPRKNGNTEVMLREALAGAEEAGARSELVTIGDKDIKGCDGCRGCDKTGRCHIKDDMQAIYPKVLEADGLIFGSPVYFWNVTGQAKVFMDRLVCLYRKSMLNNKVGGVIAVASSTGHAEVRSLYYSFFAANRMITADFVQGFAKDKGHIKKDRWAYAASRELGVKVASIAQARFKYPEAYHRSLNDMVKEKYGVESMPTDGRFDGSPVAAEMAPASRK